ncbi:hypothetical protein SteCoe_32463 [Stentor coeruleus]|uniref:Uncharacterized protein n=1 Tax=Stentor coeruleus TaxID=5963 RepID=A0A1R2AYZ8_9CILI|nr:hypothetical protein SteCoe_32463 [Stentor coeruleus]
MLFIYLNETIKSFAEYPGLQCSIKNFYLENHHEYDDSTLCSLFWMINRKDLNDEVFFMHLFDKLDKRIPEFDMKNFIYFVDGCSKKRNLIPNETIVKIQEKIKNLEGKYDSKDLSLVCNSFSKIHQEEVEDIEVFKVFERELLRLGPDIRLDAILSFLFCINKVILRYPSDTPNMMENILISRASELTPELLCKFLDVYSMLPAFYHYKNLYSVFENIILDNPEEYFLKSKTRCLSIAHAYSKLKGFNKIIGLFIKYFPTIPEDIKNNSDSLGYFLYSMLRKYPGQAYEAMLVQALFENSGKLSDLRKKKIIIGMIKRRSRNHFFLSNVQKLGVFWSRDEIFYVTEYAKRLENLGLIKINT